MQEATPLHAAAAGGHYELARLLLDNGAEVDAKNM
jgi:ankyrin repeat protein